MSDLVGSEVAGKYRVVQHLGSGGLAEVYEAVHEEIGQRFALKVLKREIAAYPEAAERFLTEARAASAVRHPGVVQIFDYGELESGEPYLIMELMEGETLWDLLGRSKKLPQEQAVGLMIQMLDALDAAHRAGVVHRDLKPENVVLVRGPGGEPWAKLIDFGIARLVHEGAAAMHRTIQGTVLGTPYYMSPEQARGGSDIDGRTDVYAAGIMLYEMLTGNLPFQGESVEEIFVKAMSDPFPSPLLLEPELPAALAAAVLKATMRKRELRFQSAQEFAQALRPLKSDLIAVQFLSAAENAQLEHAGIRPLPEPADRVTKPGWPSPTPPGISVDRAPRLLPRTSRPPSPPPDPAARSLTPPTTHPPPTPGATSRNSIVVSRRYVFIGATLGVVATAAAVVALLVVLAERTPGAGVAAVSGAGHAVAAPGPLQGSPNLGTIAASVAQPPAASAGFAAVPAVPAPVPATAPAEQLPVPSPLVAPPVPARAIVRLVGLPDEAQATLDGAPIGREFPLELSAATHTLRVVARGCKPFVHEFHVAGDLEVWVALEHERPSAGWPAPAPQPPIVPPTASGGAPGAGDPRALGNPFSRP